jgi:hypothetical protein
MTTLLVGTFALAIALAWALAKRRPEHRPVAVLLSIGLAADLGARLLDVAVIAPLRAELGVAHQWTGWARAAGLLYNALGLVWPAALVAAVLVVFLRKRPWPALAAWALAVSALALLHPIAANGSQARALELAEVIAAMVSGGIVLHWFTSLQRPASSAQFALTIIVMAEVLSLLGAWTIGPFAGWPISQVLYLTMFVIVIAIQGRFLWYSPQSQQPSA